jgi:hypothetical protein
VVAALFTPVVLWASAGVASKAALPAIKARRDERGLRASDIVRLRWMNELVQSGPLYGRKDAVSNQSSVIWQSNADVRLPCNARRGK